MPFGCVYDVLGERTEDCLRIVFAIQIKSSEKNGGEENLNERTDVGI